MKKLVSLILAIMMIAAVGAAWAATDVYSGSNQTEATSVAGKTMIPITKGIIFFNANGSNVYEPNVTFNYEVTTASIATAGTDATVTDDANVHDPKVAVTRNVYPGPTGGVTGTTISFSATNAIKTSAATGAEVEETGNLSLDITKFSKPGIYRYKITETVTNPSTGTDSERLQAAGMAARGTGYDNTRYLDVYIRNKSDGTGLEMYGAVIFKTTESTAADAGKDDITTSTKKTTGFEPGKDPSDTSYSYENDPTVDKYYTYDFSVKKTVSGSMADKNHDFPFYVSISNTITDAKYTFIDDPGTGSGAAETIASAAITKGTDSSSSALKLKDGEYVKFVGVPSNQTTNLAIVVKEFNDTYDQYTASVSAVSTTKPTISKTNGTDGSTGVMTASTGSIETASFDLKTNDIAAQILTIDNNLTEISPTGYVSRFAPYALILIGGIALLIIAKKRKPAKDEEE